MWIPKAKNYRVLHDFIGATGSIPSTYLMQHSNGGIYGTTAGGGTKGLGVVYRLDTFPNSFVYVLDWWLSDNFALAAPGGETMLQLLALASRSGVQVRAMLWKNLAGQSVFEVAGNQITPQNAKEVADINALDNGGAVLDGRNLKFGSHHQKLLVVNGSQGLIGFCGGIDINPDRTRPVSGDPGSPYHDVHCRMRGPAAADLLTVFTDRWQDSAASEKIDMTKGVLLGYPFPVPDPVSGAACTVQIGRTFGNSTKYKPDEKGRTGRRLCVCSEWRTFRRATDPACHRAHTKIHLR